MDANTITALLVPIALVALIALPIVARWRRRSATRHQPRRPQVTYDREAVRQAGEHARLPDDSIL